jgi:toxin ParE1/3/4
LTGFKPDWMKLIKFHPEAESELAESVTFYNPRVPGLDSEFFLVVKTASRQIQNDPERRPLRRDGTRKLKIPRFPYFLIYREEMGQILVVAVAHGARRPRYWRQRL